MSEEEKAIETLKEVASDDFDTLGDDISPKMAQNILNLIDNQQKEIEEKDKYIKAIADIRIQDSKENYSDVIDKYFISKDKIREKIKKAKEIKWQIPKLVIEYFEELLEENNAE